MIHPVPLAPHNNAAAASSAATAATAGPEIIAMIHVHSTTALLNHEYTSLVGVQAPTPAETVVLNDTIVEFNQVLAQVMTAYPIVAQIAPDGPSSLRSIIFLLSSESSSASSPSSSSSLIATASAVVQKGLEAIANLPFVKILVDRAVEEADVYVRNGIRCLEVENVAAPYFIGPGKCPWEELILLLLAARAIRARHPALLLGVHILSANELEVLPIAISVGAYFVRSEATLFHGIRPEGETNNRSNMARFLYARQVLRNLFVGGAATTASTASGIVQEKHQSKYPQIWSDVLKKHTVFFSELHDIDAWLHNINFMKLEGVIVTGAETGSDVDEASLAKARKAVEGFKAFNRKQFLEAATKIYNAEAGAEKKDQVSDALVERQCLPRIPVITGSGMNFDMYSRYADYCIIGSAFKHGAYWENAVCEKNVQDVVARFKKFGGVSQ